MDGLLSYNFWKFLMFKTPFQRFMMHWRRFIVHDDFEHTSKFPLKVLQSPIKPIRSHECGIANPNWNQCFLLHLKFVMYFWARFGYRSVQIKANTKYLRWVQSIGGYALQRMWSGPVLAAGTHTCVQIHFKRYMWSDPRISIDAFARWTVQGQGSTEIESHGRCLHMINASGWDQGDKFSRTRCLRLHSCRTCPENRKSDLSDDHILPGL